MQLKIASLNLRHDKPDPGNNAWIVRRQAVAALVSEHAPDIMGTQEGKPNQLLDLHRLLPDYQSVGRDRSGNSLGEHCAIFYRSGLLQPLASGDFWLSDTPEVVGSISPDWANRHPRMVTWVQFAVKGWSTTMTVFNTHLDYESAKARELGAKLISDRLSKLNLSTSFLFLTGDFNTAPGTLPRDTLTGKLSNGVEMLDALAGLELAQQMSYHEFSGQAFAPVDTIYYDSRVHLCNAQVDRRRWAEILPSDHFPVIAEFTAKELNFST